MLTSVEVIVPGNKRKIRSISLAFDPVRFSEYKVVCFIGLKVYVYGEGKGRWESNSNEYTRGVNDRGVYWNGCIHWMLELTYYDIENETMNVMPVPPVVGGHWRMDHYLGGSCDKLIYAKLCKGKYGDLRSLDVCELKRDYSEWDLKYRVDFEYIQDVRGISLLSVVHGSEDDERVVVLKIENEVWRYNVVTRTTEELPVVLKNGGTIDCAFQYIECQCDV